MGKIDVINICIRMFLFSFFTYFVYIRITNYTNNNLCKTIFIILCSIGISILYIILIQYFQPLFVMMVLYSIYGLIVYMVSYDNNNYYKIIAYIMSFAMTYLTYAMSTIISGIILLVLFRRVSTSNPISLILITSITALLLYLIFKIKRFKNGFSFLKSTNINNHITHHIILLSGIVILSYGMLQNKNGKVLNACLFIGFILIFINIIFWIKSQITKSYRSKMRDRTIEIQKTEIYEKDKIIEEIKEENLKLATAIHKYNHKFSSLEHAMKNAVVLESKTEFADELSVILKETDEALQNFSKEVEISSKNKLPLTEIPGIDNIFQYMNEEASKNNINFDLKINENIAPLIDNVIPKNKFEILIGDHLKDAIIAVNSSKNTYKSILAIVGLVDDCYEFSVYDTGIEFEIETLLKLGKERVTTHKETGGSGIGFMTTFETLKECKASLIIEEYNPKTTSYTKSVSIKFDGKNEYKICSYRAEEIKKQNKDKKIIIENL